MDKNNITGLDFLKDINFGDDFDSTCLKLNKVCDFTTNTLQNSNANFINTKRMNVLGVSANITFVFKYNQLKYLYGFVSISDTAIMLGKDASTRDKCWKFLCELLDETFIKIQTKGYFQNYIKENYFFTFFYEDCKINMSLDQRGRDSCVLSIRGLD